jgi:uncharacterized protein (TIGR03435 family)
MRRLTLAVLMLASSGAFAQNAPRPEFEVADIKLNKSGDTGQTGGILPGGQLSIRNVTLSMLLQLAYGVRANYIFGAPAWATSDHFDIIAKAPAGSEDKLPLMVQTLLGQEFKLTAHTEERPMDVYVLVVGKGGPKFQKSAEAGKVDCKRTLDARPAAEGADHPFVEGSFQAICKNITMAELGDVLQGYAPGYINKSVVDQTGLAGQYDLKVVWAPRTLVDQGGLTMFDAVDKMLGLKLDSKKLPMQVVVVDHAEKLADK